jgi:hypothetical protein
MGGIEMITKWFDHLNFSAETGGGVHASANHFDRRLLLAKSVLLAGNSCRSARNGLCRHWHGIAAAIFTLAWVAFGCVLFSAPQPVEKSGPVSLYVTVTQGDKLVRGLSARGFVSLRMVNPDSSAWKRRKSPSLLLFWLNTARVRTYTSMTSWPQFRVL